MKFKTEMWHPNSNLCFRQLRPDRFVSFRPVYPDGTVCISILHPPGEDEFNKQESASERYPERLRTAFKLPFARWRPILGVDAILLSVLSMLDQPNIDSPANVDAAVNLCLYRINAALIRSSIEMTMKDIKRR